VISSLAITDTEFTGHVWHTSKTAPIAVEYCPDTQSVHPALPVSTLYFPATHGAHDSPSAPCAPALQIQLPLPAGVCEFAKQFVHIALLAIAPKQMTKVN